MSEFKCLSFGVHKNKPIEEVPIDYLRWAIDTIDPDKRPEDYAIIEEEYIKRKNQRI